MVTAGIKILILEDSEGDQILLKYQLRELGYSTANIYVASDLTNAPDTAVNVVLCDMNLVTTSGLDTVRKARDKFLDAVLIILTGLNDLDVARKSIQMGAEDFLVKGDFKNAELEKSIDLSLERHQLKRELRLVKNQYELIFENNPVPSLIYDPKTNRILKANQNALDLYGYSTETIQGLTYDDLLAESGEDMIQSLTLDDDPNTVKAHNTQSGEHLLIQESSTPIVYSGKDRILVSLKNVTETVHLQNKLAKINERYEYVTMATSDIIYDWDLSTNRILWSQKILNLLGYENDKVEVNFKEWVNQIRPADRTQVLENYERLISDNSTVTKFSQEFKVRKIDGSSIHFTDYGIVIRNEDQKPIRILGALNDITTQNRTEVELRSSELKFSSIFYNSPIPKIIFDPATNELIEINNIALESLFGNESIDTELQMESLFDDKQRQYILSVLNENPAATRVDFGMLEIKIHTQNVRLFDAFGAFIEVESKSAVLITLIDITEKVKAEAESNELRIRQKLAFEALSAGVWDWDLKTNDIKWDEQMFTIFDVSPEERDVEKAWFKSMVPEDQEMLFNEIKLAIEKNEELSTYFRIKGSNGIKYIRSHGKIIRDQKNDAVRIVGINYDVTTEIESQKWVEAMLKDRNDILESITDGFISLDENWTIVYCNHSAEILLNKSRNFLTGRKIGVLMEDMIDRSIVSKFVKAKRLRREEIFDVYYNPAKKWLSIRLIPKKNGLVVYTQDITEKRLFHDKLLESKLRSQDQERNRIARELHDGILQELTGCYWQLKALETLEKSTDFDNKLDSGIELLQDISQQIRTVSHALASPDLDRMTMSELIERLQTGLKSQGEVEFKFDIDDDTDKYILCDKLKTHILRIIQELVNNIIKHSRATSACVKLEIIGNLIFLNVSDNGRGLRNSKGGIGLANIRERIAIIHGAIRFENLRQGGLLVSMEIPIEENILEPTN